MIKKTLSILISLAVVLSISGCSKKTNGKSEMSSVNNTVVEQNNNSNTEGEKVESSTQEKEENKVGENSQESIVDNKDKVVNNKPSTSTSTSSKPSNSTSNSTSKPSQPTKPSNTQQGNTGQAGIVQKPEEPQEPEKVKVTTKEILDGILKKIEVNRMIEMRSEMAESSYPFDRNIVEEYTIYQAMMNIKSDEIAIFKVKDKKDLGKIEKAIENRLVELERTWSQYLPDQHEKVKNYIIVKKGNYIMFSVTEYQDEVENIFKEMI